MPKSRLQIIIYFLLIYSAFVLLSLNRHSKTESFNYHSEIFSDKAGYNVYLPSLFIYHFDANSFPENGDRKTGDGFKLDSASGKVITKYPYGVSLLESPFWLCAHMLSDTKDGYSLYYQKAIDFSGCFYLTLGLFLLFFIFKKHYSLGQSVLLSTFAILSTGIFYYGIFDTGMSHIYSFCCLAFLLYLFLNKNDYCPSNYLIFITAVSLIYLVIRPVNIIFLVPLILYFLYLNDANYLNRKSLSTFTKKQIICIPLITLLILLPQLFYYKYAFGSFFARSYQNEPFVAPTFTRILQLLFSPDNGLLIYYPICLVMIIYGFWNKHPLKYLLITLFLIYILLYASWWSLSLGCSFGHRAFNDIALIFFIPLFMYPGKLKKALILTFTVLAIVNFKFIFSYDTCLYTSTNWDFTEYTSILFGEFK